MANLSVNILGYAASCAVLATFLMRTMIPLRVVAILSNVLFLLFGYIEHIYPVFLLHVALLPINSWRLVAMRGEAGPLPALRALAIRSDGARPLALWFGLGLLAGFVGSFALILIANVRHI
jgi:hypothetical protein